MGTGGVYMALSFWKATENTEREPVGHVVEILWLSCASEPFSRISALLGGLVGGAKVA